MFPLSDTIFTNLSLYAVLAITPLIFLWSERWRWLAAVPVVLSAIWITYLKPWSADELGYVTLGIMITGG